MKLIKGIVREDKVNEIAAALESIGAPEFTITRASGRGGKPKIGTFRGQPCRVLVPMAIVDVIAADHAADEIVRVLLNAAHTGHPGDGHVIVMAAEERYAVRTRWRDVA